MISDRERTILRNLAEQVKEIAANPVQEERKQLWFKINRLERCRIPVKFHVEEFCWQEILPDCKLETSDDKARSYERTLMRLIWKWENLNDDWVTEPVIEYEVAVRYPKRIAPVQNYTSGRASAYSVVPVIKDESDIDQVIIDNQCAVDWDTTRKNREWVENVFDSLLEPYPGKLWLDDSPFDYVCEIRGMENVFVDMLVRPTWLEELISRVYDQRIKTISALEDQNALYLNNGYQECFNGGLSYTDELPAGEYNPQHVRLKDIWGFTAAQAAVAISPKMHERFVTVFDRAYLKYFGLNAIACCETVDQKMDLYRTIPNLRRISVSEFNDFAKAAEEIGADYIYSVKPTGTHAAFSRWEPEFDRKYISDILEKTRGCHVEIINNTISTCRGEPKRLSDWCDIAKELAVAYSN